MAEIRDIKYVAREFSDYRQELVEFAKNYFPDTYNDFSPTSPGMMFIEMAAYVGDILSFYQDTQLQETFLQYAKDPGNLYSMAYMMGYKPKVTNAAEVTLELSQNISADGDGNPNWNDALIVDENATITSDSSGQVQFFIQNKVDFSLSSSFDPTDIVISNITGNTPNEFLLTKKTKAFSGEVKTISQTYSTAEKFTTITVDDTNIIGILDIIDSDGENWYEVPFLGQDSIFVDQANTGADANRVPNTIELQKVPKRFVTRFNSTGQLIIQFGAGTVGGDDTTFTPDPSNVGFNYDFDTNTNNSPGIQAIDLAYDPSNFLYTQTYGLAPSGTTLTIRYLVGGGVEANVPANTLNTFNGTANSVDTLDTYLDTLTVNNPKAAVGGKDGDTIEEVRQNALRSFAEQKRTITLQDYTVRAASLDPKFGTVGKVFVTQDELTSTVSLTDSLIGYNPLSLSLYVLAYDNNKKLVTATDTLKENLKTYMYHYRILTDAVNIKDAFIINIGVNFEITVLPNYNSNEVLLKCVSGLKDYFNIDRWQVNQPIIKSAVTNIIGNIQGVQTVVSTKIRNIYDSDNGYSGNVYDLAPATKNGIIYPSLDPSIFEVKYPNQDIRGRVVSS